MIKLRFDKLAAVTGGTLYNTTNAAAEFCGVTHDSRRIEPGELFVAIRGERLDGHDYIEQAIRSGASGILAEYRCPGLERITGQVPVVAVSNSHEAMLTLAKSYRNSLTARFVAITGSNGKTTTKEMTYHLVKAVAQGVFRSPGNLNNLFGVPLSLFAIPVDTTVAVLELGISTAVEMPRLAGVVNPHVVAITNVGATHLETLGTVENVARAKLELIRRSASDVPVIVNADDSILMAEATRIRPTLFTFGLDNPAAQLRPDSITHDEVGHSVVTIEGRRFRLPFSGRHQVYNLLAAYAIFKALGFTFNGVDTEAIALPSAPMRGETVLLRGITFVVDCYNANPASMRAGLESFFAAPHSGRQVVILGDMLELGPDGARYHEQIGRWLSGAAFDLAIFVGSLSRQMMTAAAKSGASASRMVHFTSASELALRIESLLNAGDRVFIKASRGIGLEAVLKPLEGGA